jgi:hypothetical protein
MPVERKGVIAVELGPTGSYREEADGSAEGGSLRAMALGVVIVALIAAAVGLFRHLSRVQELRVGEARATTDALIKAAESMERLSAIPSPSTVPNAVTG